MNGSVTVGMPSLLRALATSMAPPGPDRDHTP